MFENSVFVICVVLWILSVVVAIIVLIFRGADYHTRVGGALLKDILGSLFAPIPAFFIIAAIIALVNKVLRIL